MEHHLTLLSAPNMEQAQMLSVLLGNNNIPSLLRSRSGTSLPGLYDIGSVDILVPEEAYKRAQEVLAATAVPLSL